MNSEEFRETFLRNDREGPTKAEKAEKMTDNNVWGGETAKAGTEDPQDRRPEAEKAKAKSNLETTGTLAPVYQEGGAHDCKSMSKSERDLEFVNETMRTDQMQNIFLRLEMVAQDLIQTASGDDAQRLKRSTRGVQVGPRVGNGSAEAHRPALQVAPHGEKRGGQPCGRND